MARTARHQRMAHHDSAPSALHFRARNCNASFHGRWAGGSLSRRLIGSGEIVRNPGLKSDGDRRRRLTALQGEIAVADQARRTRSLLTRTVRHRNPMRARARCACTRLAAADLKRVTSGLSSLGNALPPFVTASLI
jgi:hypothetical protein